VSGKTVLTGGQWTAGRMDGLLL